VVMVLGRGNGVLGMGLGEVVVEGGQLKLCLQRRVWS
jgi:hypothetical protein